VKYDPELVGSGRGEVAVDVVGGPLRLAVGASRANPLGAPGRPSEALCSHQTLDLAARGTDSLATQLPPGLLSAVDREVLFVDPADLGQELAVAEGASVGVALALLARVVGGGGELQVSADRLDPESVAVGVDEEAHLLGIGGSSSRAKKPRPP